MRISPSVEMVVASHDDPIAFGLRVEQEAERATVSGTSGGLPRSDVGAVFVVARHAYALVGCAGMRRLCDDTAEVTGVYVRPEFHEPDIARMLLSEVEDLARRRGFSVLRLDAPDEAEPYTSGGYTRRGAGLEKSLAPRQGAGHPAP